MAVAVGLDSNIPLVGRSAPRSILEEHLITNMNDLALIGPTVGTPTCSSNGEFR